MPAAPFDDLQTKLERIVKAQLALNWTPPALRKSLETSLGSVASIGATMDLADPAGNGFTPAEGQGTDALTLGVGVSASVAAKISMGLTVGVGVSASASLGAKLIVDLHSAISLVGSLERDLEAFNAEASLVAGHRGVMPAGRKVDQSKVNSSLRSLTEGLNECQSKATAAAAARPISPISAEVRMPRVGEWYCDVHLDQDAAETGKIRIKLDEFEFTGTAVPEKTGTDGNRAICRIMAGNGRIRRSIGSHSYSSESGVTAGTVVRDILKDCGEDLSDLADADALAIRLPRWHVPAGTTAANALTKLADACDCAWRMLRDGTVWFGKETWPEVEPDGTLVDENWADGCVTLAADSPAMVPGTLFQGQKIEQVTHTYGESLRTEIRTSSVGSALRKALRGSRDEIDFSREYPCKVVTQNADGTLQLLPDDEVMRARGLDAVPIRYGLPGCSARLKPGARCHLAFAAGDPSRPYVGLWEFAPEFVESLTLHADRVTLGGDSDGEGQDIARKGDSVDVPMPPAIFSGTISGAPATGVLTFPAMKMVGAIAAGSTKAGAAS